MVNGSENRYLVIRGKSVSIYEMHELIEVCALLQKFVINFLGTSAIEIYLFDFPTDKNAAGV